MRRVYLQRGEADRYDAARGLPPETTALWMEVLAASVGPCEPRKVLDLGCGTGRFTIPLAEKFRCPVVAVEPSEAMLDVARARTQAGIEWRLGSAESIPQPDRSVDLVFMSQVFHHLEAPSLALLEIDRVLTSGGRLAIRNGTIENNRQAEWLRHFPEALAVEKARMPSRTQVVERVSARAFRLVSFQTVSQRFAESHEEYVEKIARRGLSSLIAITDEAFVAGLRRLRHWADGQPQDGPIHEPVDLFVFERQP